MGLKLIAAGVWRWKKSILFMTVERRLTDDPGTDWWAHRDYIIGPPRHKEIESPNEHFTKPVGTYHAQVVPKADILQTHPYHIRLATPQDTVIISPGPPWDCTCTPIFQGVRTQS